MFETFNSRMCVATTDGTRHCSFSLTTWGYTGTLLLQN